MAWIQIRLNSTNEKAEKISDFLEEIGSVSVTFMDSQDTPIFEPLPGETRLWGNTDVIALFDAETDMSEIVSLLKQAHHLDENTAYKIEQIEDKDWEREWMDNFHPMQFGQRLWICPSWREVPDKNAVNVMLDPGLAWAISKGSEPAICTAFNPNSSLCAKRSFDFSVCQTCGLVDIISENVNPAP
jgi:ribosomal protein L11 methyltransferase